MFFVNKSESESEFEQELEEEREEEEEEDDWEGEEDHWGSDLMGDQEDRKMLAAMSEIDRELILQERSEKVRLLLKIAPSYS